MKGEARLPVTIVTGFLGSGKTTLVNHILARQHGLKVAVMVNEIGDIAIDNALIVGAAPGMVELANGCICCSINNDLVDAIFRVLQRAPAVDCLIVETSGLADPLPIVLTFLRSEFRERVRLDAIVAVADAENFSLDLFDSKAAVNQLRYADVVLLNKCDRAGTELAAAVEQSIRRLSDGVRIVRTTRAQIPLPLILGAGLFRAERYPADHGRQHLNDDGHLIADGFETVSFESASAFSADRFQSFLETLPGNVFRAKGILRIDGSDAGHVFHLVGRRFTLDPAPPDQAGGSRLVLIGRGLDAGRLRAALAACVADQVTADRG
jgi:G3E family GTPase